MFHQIATSFPDLKQRLTQARMPETPDEFIKRTFMSSLMISFGVFVLFLGTMMHSFGYPFLTGVILFPLGFFIFFTYFIKVPDVKIKKLEKGINKEIVFATRFLIIELESEVPMYNAFINISKVYPNIGIFFRAIIDRIDMGTMMEDSINETASIVPSGDLQRILWQIVNSIKTGAEISGALRSVVDQIVKEQEVEVKEYGRKLNPLAMFYMMIAVIIPSLGITMLIIFSSFIGFKLSFAVLMTLAGLLLFVQFMFYGLIKSSRPSVEF